MRSKVFIGTSKESLELAYAVQENLQPQAQTTVWTAGIFEGSKSLIETLITSVERFDFGVFVFGPNDTLKLGGLDHRSARDNVIFELGLFVGRLGKARNFLLVPRDGHDSGLPIDFFGTGPIILEADLKDPNVTAAVSPACRTILKTIQRCGPIHADATDHKIRPSLLTPDSPLLNQLINSAIHTVCRAMALPMTPEASRIRVFIFRKEANELVCTHYWAPNPVREMVRRLRFNVNSEVAENVAVVRALINAEITRTRVSPLPEPLSHMREEISDDLSFVLAAPIYNTDGSVWGTVDFDACSESAETLLSDKVSDAAMVQLAKHLQIIFSLPDRSNLSSDYNKT